MELLTDILAIFGWALFGISITSLKIFSFKDDDYYSAAYISGVSFGLIAASLVLG
jgi:hypothetical protein